MCRALDREDLTPYKSSPEHFTGPPEKEWDEVQRELEKIFRTRTREEWFEFLSQYNVPVSKVNNIAEAFMSPQSKGRNMLGEIEDSELGKVKQVMFPIKFSETPARIFSPPPHLGEHTLEVLHSLGYDKAAIDGLIQRKVTSIPLL